jgi:uncharacterized membrane protein
VAWAPRERRVQRERRGRLTGVARGAAARIIEAMASEAETTVRHPRESLVTLAHVIYALHAFSAFTAFLSSALIIVAFLTGWPSIIAVILNYAKRSEVRGTWLESHFGWQIRTFWYALLWLLLGGVAFVTFFGIPVAVAVWIATGLWVLYRIARGWMTLSAQKAMPERAPPG